MTNGNDITIGGLIYGTGDLLAYAKDNGVDVADLIVNAAVTKATAGASILDLRADNNISIWAAANPTASAGLLDILLDADYNNDTSGAITINSSVNTNGGNLRFKDAVTSSTFDTTWNAGTGTITTDNIITLGTRNLTMIADGVALGGNITGTGTLTLKPSVDTTSIGLGGGAGTFNLTDTELGYLNTSNVVIGDSSTGAGDFDIDSWDLSAKTHNVQLFGRNFDLGGITTGAGNVYAYANGGTITTSANSTSNAAGNLTLLGTHNIAINNTLANAGTGKINIFAGWNGSSGITTPALFNLDNVLLGLTARNITIGANGSISSAGAGTSVLLVASGALKNNATAGVNAISAAGGRYLVYSDNPTDTVKNGLTAKSLYNKTYATALPSSIAGASRFVYKYQPTLTLTADDISALDVPSAVYSYAVSGLINGDLTGDALSGTPSYTLGSLTGNTYPIQMAAGSTASAMGYALAYINGVLTITGTTPPPTPPAVTPVTPPVTENLVNYTSNVKDVSVAKERGEAEVAQAEKAEQNGSCLVADASGCILH